MAEKQEIKKTFAHSQIRPQIRPQIRDDLNPKDWKRVLKVTAPTGNFSKAENFEATQGGAATSRKLVNRNAFSHSSSTLRFEDELTFKLGNALFRKFWASSPASTHASDGLGPFYNARSCQSCHLKDGRGHPPAEGETDFTSLLLRLARLAETDDEKKDLASLKKLALPDPIYGNQVQDFAIQGLKAEAKPTVTYEETKVILSGGEVVFLRKPTFKLTELAHGPLHEKTTLSPRIAPPMIGLGLIEAIHSHDIMNRADERDANKDGISGKIPVALDENGKPVLSRFGWKATKASLHTQNAAAFHGDIGLSSSLHKNPHGDCTTVQQKCLSRATGVQKHLSPYEVSNESMELVNFYTAHLAVPARRNVDDKAVLQGKKAFYDLGCIACHQPKYVTSRNAARKEHRFQLIWPYSDFLLHDMGKELADNQPVGVASGQEWRTPPLWGIGLTKTVNGHTFFLHDGRARSLTEAILWHGGEGAAARNRFAESSKETRMKLIKFLESL